jgi:hypothetical protein
MCPPYHPRGCFPGARSPKSVFENKTGRGGERRERERERVRKKRKRRKRRALRKEKEPPANNHP